MQKRHASLEEILDHITSAEKEMYVNGIVAVGDICNTAHTIPVKSKRLLHYHNFVEASGVDGKQADKKFAQVLAIYEAFASLSPVPFLSNSIVPHSAYSVSAELWEMMANFPGNRLLSIHNQEDPNEDEWFLSHTGQFRELYAGLGIPDSLLPVTGRSSLQSVKDRFSRNQEILLVHNVTTSTDDLLSLKDNKTAWCLCPNANKYITGLMPPVKMLMNNDAKIVLGTDSLASNHQLSIYAEIQIIRKEFPELQLGSVLRWATSNGADVLGISREFGSIAKGKKPGLVIINEDQARRVL
jgi:cytosine/adenosine deaminase-related metal-dependent hydrolase